MYATVFALSPKLVLTFFFFLGVIIGSFLNVFIYRLHTSRSINGSSHCLSCGTPLKFYELFPLFSYLFLRGRCRTCGSFIPKRYFLVELMTGILFLATALSFTNPYFLGLFLVIMAVLVVVFVYDLYHMIIPDEMVIALVVLAFIQQGFLFFFNQIPLSEIGFNLGAGFLATLFLFSLWFYSRGTWLGFGDVKLVFPLAVLVGFEQVFSLVILSFWVGAAIGLTLLGFQYFKKRGKPHLLFLSRELTMKSAVPFAPFLIIGFWLEIFFAFDVVGLLIYVP